MENTIDEVSLQNSSESKGKRVFYSKIEQQSYKIRDDLVESILSKKDGRVKVEFPTGEYPWSMHGHMTMLYKYPTYKDTYVGSGIMINHSHVLTAGHNLFSSKNGRIPDEVKFYPGRQGGYTPWCMTGKKFKVHRKYYDSENYDYDISVLVLEEQIGHQTGWSRLAVFDDNRLLEGLSINITGYPYDKFELDQPYMYTMNGSVMIAHQNRFYYDVDTSPGQSGSGVYVINTESEIIDCLGIHTTGSRVEGNGATRINKEKLNVIEKWVTS